MLKNSINSIIIIHCNGKTYYYPEIPKLNKFGNFTNNIASGSKFYGGKTTWDEHDDSAPITNVNERDNNLILNIDFDQTTTDDLIDKTNLSKPNYPSLKTPGIYPSGSIQELGLDNDDLEKFSLGNWNTFIKGGKIFGGVQSERIVNIGFESTSAIQLNYIEYRRYRNTNGSFGAIMSDTIQPAQFFPWGPTSPPDRGFFSSGYGIGWDPQKTENRELFFNAYGKYYDLPQQLLPEADHDDNGDSEIANNERWENRTFKPELVIDINNTLAFIKERGDDPLLPLVFEPVDYQPFANLIHEIEIITLTNDGPDYTFGLIFPRRFKFKSPSTSDTFWLSGVQRIPHPFFEGDASSNFFEINIVGELETSTYDIPLADIGAPNFLPAVGYEVSISSMIIDDVRFLVKAETNNENEFLYYDRNEKPDLYIDTSYPVEVKFNLSLLDYPDFDNTIEFGQNNISNNVFTLNADDSFFDYQVIQWGDEKILLTNDQIEQTYFFSLYDSDEYPEPDSYILKKANASQKSETKGIENEISHIYNTPGVKSIKIVVYRYNKDKTILAQTYLITKNIVINDGLLKSQDFKIFGGTDFNFLPLKTKDIEGEQRPLEAIIGGLDEDSKYNNSVEKIKKDDNFIEEDYLERASSKDFIDNFNKKLYGETPGQLDLSTTRMYKKPLDIYDFITNDKQSIVDNNFNINTLPINSSATDIFISNNDCIVDVNPQDIEYLSIQNKTGIADKAILIGDYKVNQPKDGKIQREGVMETPLLDDTQDKQAF